MAGSDTALIGKWLETDKPADTRCFLDMQCPEDACCGDYPDSNNKRCMKKVDHMKSITLGPVTLTPSCPSLLGGSDGSEIVPENAQDDISKGALSEAKEELDKFFEAQLSDAKAASKYDTDECDDQCKLDFDEGAQAAKERRE